MQPGRAGAGRIGAPFGLPVALPFETFRQPALDVLHHHPPNVAERPRTHEVAGLLHHGIAGVVVGEPEDQTGLLDEGGDFLGLGEIEGDGLVRHDVEARVEGGLGDGEMGVVRRRDHHEVHAVVRRARGLGGHHLPVGAVAADLDRCRRALLPAARLLAGSLEKAPHAIAMRPSSSAAIRCTAPMNAPFAATDQAHLEFRHRIRPLPEC